MALDDVNGRQLLTEDSSPELVDMFRRHATRRGLVLEFPLFDLTDTLVLNVNDVWDFRSDEAWQLSSRYQSDTLFMGRVSVLSSGQWIGRWRYE